MGRPWGVLGRFSCAANGSRQDHPAATCRVVLSGGHFWVQMPVLGPGRSQKGPQEASVSVALGILGASICRFLVHLSFPGPEWTRNVVQGVLLNYCGHLFWILVASEHQNWCLMLLSSTVCVGLGTLSAVSTLAWHGGVMARGPA